MPPPISAIPPRSRRASATGTNAAAVTNHADP